MTDQRHLTLRVELDSQDGSIAGQVLDGGAAGRSFSGWIGLAAAIEQALHVERAVPRSRAESLGLEEQ